VAKAQAAARQQGELRDLVRRMLDKAEVEKWSRRVLAARCYLTRGTFNRMVSGQLDARTWLPRIREAAARIAA
jgi:hypothetical protein